MDYMKQCALEGCESVAKSKGFCLKHYQEQYRKKQQEKKKSGLCMVDGCHVEVARGKYCTQHFNIWTKFGRTTPVEVCKEDGCDSKVYAKELCRSHYMKEKKQNKFESKIIDELDKTTERNKDFYKEDWM